MAGTTLTRHPLEWASASISEAMVRSYPAEAAPVPLTINRITLADLTAALREGFADFVACRSDAAVLCLIYPLAGLLLARIVMGDGLLPLLFPLIAGYALVGPLFATGIYQMSRIREREGQANWADAFSAFGSPALGSIITLGLWLCATFTLWMSAAIVITNVTIGPYAPASLGGLFQMVLTTPQGATLGFFGIAAGAIFAALVLAMGVISFPLLLDRNCGVIAAVSASLDATRQNLVPIAAWGLIVAASLVLGSLPFLIGLAVVIPVLGHATWHLYRKLVTPA